jgi:nitrogen regulatory protein PII-like uncharacterized protein
MQTLPKKRIEIFVEVPLLRRVLAVLDELGVPGYSLMDMAGGRGGGAAWSESGEIGNATRMVSIVSLVEPEQVERIMTRLSSTMAGRIGVAAISDVEVVSQQSAPG